MTTGGVKFTRREVVSGAAKAGAAGAALLWVAPKFQDVAYASGGTTSAASSTTSSSTATTISGQGGVECRVDPKVLTHVPWNIRVIGSGWAASSSVHVTLVGHKDLGHVTAGPNGKFDTRVAEAITSATPQGKYRIEFSGFDSKGVSKRCFVDFELNLSSTGGQGSTTASTRAGSSSGAGSGSQSGSGNGSGSLPLTGDNSTPLILLGAGALVAGRSIYALRNRLAEAGDGNLNTR